jgi:hypothetical protein
MANSLTNVSSNDFGAVALRGGGKDYECLTRKFGMQLLAVLMMSQNCSLMVVDLREA